MVAYDRRVLPREVRKGGVALELLSEPLRFGDCTRSMVDIRRAEPFERISHQDDCKVILVHKPLVLSLSKNAVPESVCSSTLRQAQGSSPTDS